MPARRLNKCDLVSPDQARVLQAVLQALNPGARIIATQDGACVSPELVLKTGKAGAGARAAACGERRARGVAAPRQLAPGTWRAVQGL